MTSSANEPFKIVLLGDEGVGKTGEFLYKSLDIYHYLFIVFARKCLAQVLQYSEMTLLGNLLLMVYYRLIAFMYRLITFASVVKSLLVFPPPRRLGKLCLFGHQSDLRTSSRSAGLPIRQFA